MSVEIEEWPRATVLVQMELPEVEELALPLLGLLGSLRVVLLGTYAVPEQTSPEQAREQLGEECAASLEGTAARLRAAGAEVDARVVFTADVLETVDRVAREEACDAVLLSRPVEKLGSVLVALGGVRTVRTLSSFLGHLLVGSEARLTLLHVRESGNDHGMDTWIVEEARELVEGSGVEGERVQTRLVDEGDVADAILEEAAAHDVLVLGESEAGFPDLIFGTFSERVAREADVPVFVISRPGRPAPER